MYEGDRPPSPAPVATNRKSNKYTTVSLSLVAPRRAAEHVVHIAVPHLQHSQLICARCLFLLCVFKCDPTFVIVEDMIRLHFRAKIEFCTQSCPILKNTLSYIFQINIGPFS